MSHNYSLNFIEKFKNAVTLLRLMAGLYYLRNGRQSVIFSLIDFSYLNVNNGGHWVL